MPDTWRPIETWEESAEPILRPHIIHGPMDVTFREILGAKRWINADLTTYWPDDAFMPFWMPRPAMPEGWYQGWHLRDSKIRKINDLKDLK